MKFIDKFIRTFEGALQKKLINSAAQDIDLVRQNSPPDERDADIAEAGGGSETTPSLSEAVEQEKRVAENRKVRAKKAGGKS